MLNYNGIIPLYGTPAEVIKKAKSCYVYDNEGRKYLDLEAGVWASNLGHNNKKINNALKNAMDKTFHQGYGFRNYESEKLSDNILNLLEFKNGACTFLSSGSEAVNLSIILARHCTGRKKVVKISNSYLSAFGFGSLSTDNTDRLDVLLNDINSIKEINFTDVAAIVFEVGGASLDGVKFPDNDFIDELYKAGRSSGSIIIADEVTTGICRTGKWFGYMHYDIEPDIVVTGKGLGNGYPVSSVAVNEKMVNELIEKPIRYAQSHQNDPSGCRVGNAVIKYCVKKDIANRVEKIGKYFISELNLVQEQHKAEIKEVRGKGLMIGVELMSEQEAERIKFALLKRGFIVGCKGSNIRLMPPLVIKKKMIDEFIFALKNVL